MSNEATKAKAEIVDFADLIAELRQARYQLTITQAECTKLLLEKRELESRLGIAGALAQVREFHEKFGVEILDRPAIPSSDREILRHNLISEEWLEFSAAWSQRDLVEIADALADMIYVILGTALSYGIPLAAVFDEVHRTNMLKVGGATRDDGKILKPEGWKAPDIAGILRKAGE